MEPVGEEPLIPAAPPLGPEAGSGSGSAERRTGRRAEIADGWRLARPTLDEAFTPRRIRVLVIGASAVAIVVSAILRPVLTPIAAGWQGVVLALGGGLLAAVVLASILPYRWRPPVATGTASAGQSSLVRAARLKDGDETSIGRAWASHAEPDVAIDRRLAAADQALRYRESAPRFIVTAIAPTVSVVPLVLIGIGLFPVVSVFVAMFGAVNSIVAPLTVLAALGRTRHAIETRPDVPGHLEANGGRKPRPWRSLGTDHPDDYT